jgi:hypothetical protein
LEFTNRQDECKFHNAGWLEQDAGHLNTIVQLLRITTKKSRGWILLSPAAAAAAAAQESPLLHIVHNNNNKHEKQTEAAYLERERHLFLLNKLKTIYVYT